MTDREQVERDLEQLAQLAPTLGRNAQHETPLDVLADIDHALAWLVATTIVDSGTWWTDGFAIRHRLHRLRIRGAARARKARR